MDILIFSVLTNFIYFCSGSLFVSEKKNDFHSQFYIYFIGVIFLSFISLVLNFFVPLSSKINSIIHFIIFISFLIKKKFKLDTNFLNFLFASSLITFLLIIYSNVNRPDAGLYHLPYISIINENKIIFGINNIHIRFGHVSILQYLSAINNNLIFSANGVSIPLASIVSFFYLYFFYDIWKVIKENKSLNESNFFSLFILIYISYKITNYSNFGNDAVGHLSFFYLISCLLKNNLKIINFNKILLVSVFAFLNKTMLVFAFLIPLSIFFLKNKFQFKRIFSAFYSMPAILLYLWFIKNIITSGCAIYPITITCIEKLPWVNIDQVITANIEGEAWSKGWPDKTGVDSNLSTKDFIKNLNWVNAWSNKHLKYILNTIAPFIIILIFITFYIHIKYKKIIINFNQDFKIRYTISFVTSLIGVFFFLLLFPLYRYGYSYVITFLSLFFIFIIKDKIDLKKNLIIFKFFFIFCIFLVMTKQFQRIYTNAGNEHWPNIYTLSQDNIIKESKKVEIDDKFFYYLSSNNDSLCMYSKSPCATSFVDKNIKHIQKYSYSFLIFR
jgi:hypothetical protein